VESRPKVGALVAYKWHTCIVKAYTADGRVYLQNYYTKQLISRPIPVKELVSIEEREKV
jgi:hypothetical protein